MEPIAFLTVMACASWFTNIYDYVVFSYKHRQTQDQVRHLKGEMSTLNTRLGYMSQEISENNKIIKDLTSKLKK
jgi:hypothetical protein